MPNKIGQKIKILRKSRGMTQQQLADMLDVQRATISNYEIGRRSPHLKELENIAEVLGVNLDYFAVFNNSLNDLVARARIVFDDDEIPRSEKDKCFKEILKLYLELDEN